MKWLRIWITMGLVALATPVLAETIHLKGGETIKGRIIGITNETITIESEKGYGVLQVPRKDVLLIEYPDEARDPSRMIGFGYQHRTSPLTGNGAEAEYGVDALSIKYWLNAHDSFDIQFGFFSAINDGDKMLEVFSLDLRYAHVFKRQAELDLYYGGALGYLAVEDRTIDPSVDDSGFGIKAFLGAEIFFVTLPNLGLAAELGIGTQQIGDRSTTSITSTTFPTFSARYYF
jgi:RNase P/RNase MRP subunit p29